MRLTVLIISLSLFVQCSPTSETNHNDIEEIESVMFKNQESASDSIKSIAFSRYLKFVEENPKDDMASTYMFRAANVARSLNKLDESIGICRSIIKDYPDFDNVSAAHFMIAFIYDNDFNDKKKASEVYEQVAKKYPNEQFGKDAKMRLTTINMSDEELIEFFEQKNAKP